MRPNHPGVSCARFVFSSDLQAGVGIGEAFWAELYREHSLRGGPPENQPTKQDGGLPSEIKKPGVLHARDPQDEFETDPGIKRFFDTSRTGQLVPRALFVDLDDGQINRVKKGPLRDQFNKSIGYVVGKEDSSNSYSRAHYSVGRNEINRVEDHLRKHAESCEQMQGFLMTHSIAGGCGSGLGTLISERISVDFPKKQQIHYTVYPDYSSSETIVSPFNCVLSTHGLLEHSDLTVVMQNSSMMNSMEQNLVIPEANFYHLNRLVAHHAASILSGVRYNETGGYSLSQITSSLRPYPRIHFAAPSFAPWGPPAPAWRDPYIPTSVYASTLNLMEPESVFATVPLVKNQLFSSFVMYRGDVSISDCHQATNLLKETKWPNDPHGWSPNPFTVARSPWREGAQSHKDLDLRGVTVSAITNSPGCTSLFRETTKRFDQLYSNRGFYWWFYGEGMEKGEFCEAREDLEALIKDYEECSQPPAPEQEFVEEE